MFLCHVAGYRRGSSVDSRWVTVQRPAWVIFISIYWCGLKWQELNSCPLPSQNCSLRSSAGGCSSPSIWARVPGESFVWLKWLSRVETSGWAACIRLKGLLVRGRIMGPRFRGEPPQWGGKRDSERWDNQFKAKLWAGRASVNRARKRNSHWLYTCQRFRVKDQKSRQNFSGELSYGGSISAHQSNKLLTLCCCYGKKSLRVRGCSTF